MEEDKKPEISKEEHKTKNKMIFKPKGNLTKKIRKNPWIISTLVLGILTLILVTGNLPKGITMNIVSEDIAAKNLIEFLNQNSESEVTFDSISDEGSLYKIDVEYQGQIIPLYMTKDGKYYVQGIVPITRDDSQNQEESEGYSEEDLEKISIFIDCLTGKDVKIYGANWCGYTKALVETFGGFDIISPIYVECTEEQELCASEGVKGYPTIKIDGELYGGSRTFEDFAEATGCPVPEVSNTQSTSTEEASCG